MRCWVVGADWLEVIAGHRCGSGWGEGAHGTLILFPYRPPLACDSTGKAR